MTWATSVPILVYLGLSVLDFGPMYATDRCQTDVTSASLLMHPMGGGIIIIIKFIQRHMVTTSEAPAAGRISVQ